MGIRPDLLPRVGENVAQSHAAQPALAGDDGAVGGDGHVAQARAAGGDEPQTEAAQRLLREPAGTGKVQLHAQTRGDLHGVAENVLQLGGGKTGGDAALGGGAAGGDKAGAGGIAHAQRGGEAKRVGIVAVHAAKGRVDGHDKPRSHGIFDAGHGVAEAVHPHEGVVYGGLVAVKRHLHAVEAGFIQRLAQLRRQTAAVGVQPRDEPLGGVHQLHQIAPQSRLAAGEGDLGDVGRLQALQNFLPLSGIQLLYFAHRLAGGVAVQAFLVAVPQAVAGHGADHEIHAVGGGHLVGVLAQRQGGYLHLRLLASGDGHQRAQQNAHVLPQHLGLYKGIDLFLGAADGLLQHGVPVVGADLQPRVRLHAVHELRQQHCPGEVQRHQLRAVEQQQEGVVRRLGVGRDHMDAHHTGAGGIQRNMTHAS